jgi:hypothetical protein
VAAGGGHAEKGFPDEEIRFDSGSAHGWAVVGFELGHGETQAESDDVSRDAHTGHADRATAIALEEIHGRKKKNKRTERLRLGAEKGDTAATCDAPVEADRTQTRNVPLFLLLF